MVTVSSEMTYSADDLELEGARRLCLSERSYNSVILLTAEISSLRTRSVTMTCIIAKKKKEKKCTSFFIAQLAGVIKVEIQG